MKYEESWNNVYEVFVFGSPTCLASSGCDIQIEMQ